MTIRHCGFTLDWSLMFLWQDYVEPMFVLSETAVAQAARFRISRPADRKKRLAFACILRAYAVACVQHLCIIIGWKLG